MRRRRIKLKIGLFERAPWAPFFTFNWFRQKNHWKWVKEGWYDPNWDSDPYWFLLFQAGRFTINLKRI